MAQAERVADGEHEITHPDALGITDRHVGQPFRIDLDDCDVGRSIRADDLCIEDFPVHRRDLDLVGLVNDVVVGQDIAVLGVDDDARTGARDLALPAARDVRQAEKAPERFVAEVPASADSLAHSDVHDGRRYPLHERRQARQFLAIDHCR